MDYTPVAELIVPFIALIFLCVVVDQFVALLELVVSKLPGFPDHFERPAALLIGFIFSYTICWQAAWDFFIFLGVIMAHNWQGWAMTSFLLVGGVPVAKKIMSIVGEIPGTIYGVSSGASNQVLNYFTAKRSGTLEGDLNEDRRDKTYV